MGLEHVITLLLSVTPTRSRYEAVRTVVYRTSGINAVIVSNIKPVILGAEFAFKRICITFVTLCNLAGQSVALLVPYVKIVACFASVTVVDSR